MNDFYTKAIRYLAYHHNVTIEDEVYKYYALQFVSEESDRCFVTVGSKNHQTVIITIIMLMLALNIDKPLYVHTPDGETLIADMFHEYDDIPVNYKFPLPYKLGIITIVRCIKNFVVPDVELFEKLMNKTPDDIIKFVSNVLLTSEMFGVSNVEYRNIVVKRLDRFNQNSKGSDILL